MHIGHTANIKFIAQFLVLFLILFGESRVFTEVTEGSITAKMPWYDIVFQIAELNV